ncbi:hypothetical protein [Micromonospora sonneratiae]|uniref:Alpha/beta hydrolase family protein n=1 Tax=Micromonospora sonneratiae TaxID=1184706 RepID=A0ABW3YF58_9ACTN
MRTGPTLVLIHSPLVGPGTWLPVAAELRARGYQVVVPAVSAVTEAEPPYYRWLADRVREDVDSVGVSDRVMLIGHSGAGALLPVIGAGLPGGAYGAVFVDAMLPHPGTSWFANAPAALVGQLRDLAVDGRLPPWHRWFPAEVIQALLPDEQQREHFIAELRRLPLAYFAEPAPSVPEWSPQRCAYLQLSDGYDPEAAEAQRRGWTVRHEPADHLALLTQPGRISTVLDQTIRMLMDTDQ